MARDNKDIWELVDFDPLCTQMTLMQQVISREYPHFLALALGRVAEMLRAETYDRICKGETDGVPVLPGQPDGSQPLPGGVKHGSQSV